MSMVHLNGFVMQVYGVRRGWLEGGVGSVYSIQSSTRSTFWIGGSLFSCRSKLLPLINIFSRGSIAWDVGITCSCNWWRLEFNPFVTSVPKNGTPTLTVNREITWALMS